jgi:hypothetical protein
MVAQLHDVGYAAIAIYSTLQGMAWQNRDTRQAHMEASREMSRAKLEDLRLRGDISIPQSRVEKLLEIVATHDDPYLGRPLCDFEALAHRDADRTFVISCVSFWKDFIAWSSDSREQKKREERGIPTTPESFLAVRNAGFLRHDSSQLVDLNEGGFEPMTTELGLQIYKDMHNNRALEIARLRSSNWCFSEVSDFFVDRIRAEITALASDKSS